MSEIADPGLYVYGVVRVPAPGLPDIKGMDGHPLELVGHEGLGAVVTAVSLERLPGRRKELLSHSDVLNAVAHDHDVVPLRFGTILADADSVVEELLKGRYEHLASLLEQLADGVQLNLRASYVEDRVLADVVRSDPEIRDLHERTIVLPVGTPSSEALRLGRLVAAAVAQMRRVDSALLAECVLPMVRDSRTRERTTTDHVLDMALLVDRESVGRVEAELERVAADVHERIRLRLTGPLAPFEFVEEPAWA